MFYQPQHHLQDSGFNARLRLLLRPRQDVADRAQAWDRDGEVGELHQLDESVNSLAIDEGLEAFLSLVGNVREGPADIADDLLVVVLNQHLAQGHHRLPNQLKLRHWSSSAEV